MTIPLIRLIKAIAGTISSQNICQQFRFTINMRKGELQHGREETNFLHIINETSWILHRGWAPLNNQNRIILNYCRSAVTEFIVLNSLLSQEKWENLSFISILSLLKMVIGQAIQQYQYFALHLQFHIVVQKINYETYGPAKNECLIEVNNSNLSKKGCGHLNRMQQLSFINWTCAWRSFGDLWSTRTWFLAIRNNGLIMQEEEYFQQYHDSAKESKANLVRKIKWQHFSSNKEYYLFHLW